MISSKAASLPTLRDADERRLSMVERRTTPFETMSRYA
jgi:hypothetical protein